MFQKLIRTNPNNTAAFVLRLALGAVMFPHGAQKMLGWFGGYGFSATMQGMTSSMGLPGFMVFLVIMIEFVGAIALILGFMGRLMSFGIGVVMAGAMFMAHWANGFFMNWSGKQAGEGFEYHLLAIGMAIALTIMGSGRWSVDSALQRKERVYEHEYEGVA
jgi:putative oxidoreductase